jgi:hypothetical protein
VREGRRGGGAGVFQTYRYVEPLCTTTTNFVTEKARRDKTRQRSQLREQASQRYRAYRSGAQSERDRKEGSVVGRGARGHQQQTSHKMERKRSITQFIISSCRQDTHHLI